MAEFTALEQDRPASAKGMAQEFRTNPVAAKAHYEGRRLDVQGVVRYNGPDMFGLASLELSDGVDGPCDVLCVFGDEDPIRDIREGTVVTVRGNFIDCAPKYGPTFKKCEVLAAR